VISSSDQEPARKASYEFPRTSLESWASTQKLVWYRTYEYVNSWYVNPSFPILIIFFIYESSREGAHASLNDTLADAHVAMTLLTCITETPDLNVGRTPTLLRIFVFFFSFS
jgi:hypothetical protein